MNLPPIADPATSSLPESAYEVTPLLRPDPAAEAWREWTAAVLAAGAVIGLAYFYWSA